MIIRHCWVERTVYGVLVVMAVGCACTNKPMRLNFVPHETLINEGTDLPVLVVSDDLQVVQTYLNVDAEDFPKKFGPQIQCKDPRFHYLVFPSKASVQFLDFAAPSRKSAVVVYADFVSPTPQYPTGVKSANPGDDIPNRLLLKYRSCSSVDIMIGKNYIYVQK